MLGLGRLRVYDLPAEALEESPLDSTDGGSAALPDNLPTVLYVDEGETIYDFAWYPGMLASEPSSCVFASTGRVRAASRHCCPEHLLKWIYEGCSNRFIPASLEQLTSVSSMVLPAGTWHQNERIQVPQNRDGSRCGAIFCE